MCKHCGKRFAEDNSFAPKYYQVTLRLIDEIFKKTESERSFTTIDKEPIKQKPPTSILVKGFR